MVLSSHAIASGVYGRPSAAVLIFNYVGAVGLGDLVGAAPSNVAEEHVFGMSPPQPVSTLEGTITDNHHFKLILRGGVRHKR